MSVKLIAVDMDGTFLDDLKQYNRPRFLAQYARMKEQGIRFAVASGNQYFQLYSFFRKSPMRSPLWPITGRGWSVRAMICSTVSLPFRNTTLWWTTY